MDNFEESQDYSYEIVSLDTESALATWHRWPARRARSGVVGGTGAEAQATERLSRYQEKQLPSPEMTPEAGAG